MAENKVVSAANPAQSSGLTTSRYIHLNVGGTTYMTSQETLTRYPDSMLGHMFTQERIPLAKDDQGRFLIDRDGASFRHILNFLRGGTLCLPESSPDYAQLLEEARFYQLDELVKGMCVHLNVNGVNYSTTKAILPKYRSSRLGAIFAQNSIPLDEDQEGRYLLRSDDNGELFQYILNYLEGKDLGLPEKFDNFGELEKLAKNYELEAIIRALQVCLIVGGQEYTTAKTILTKEKGSLLEEMFSQTPIPLERDRLGRFVIDRDGEMFKYILNFLKDGNLGLRGDTIIYHSQLDPEVEYYNLETMKQFLKMNLICYFGSSRHIAWKYLAKYEGSSLKEEFGNATVQVGPRCDGILRGDGRSIQHILTFLETGNLVHVPHEDYPKLREEAGRYRLHDLQRLLADDE